MSSKDLPPEPTTARVPRKSKQPKSRSLKIVNKDPCTLEEIRQAIQHAKKTPAALRFHGFLVLEQNSPFGPTWLAREILKVKRSAHLIPWSLEWQREIIKTKKLMEELEELAELEEEEIQREIAAECAGIEARVRARHAEAKEERRKQAEAKEELGT
ncbi:hypothetical protein RQP46_008937 [Phenoliferia psychrophenolica]